MDGRPILSRSLRSVDAAGRKPRPTCRGRSASPGAEQNKNGNDHRHFRLFFNDRVSMGGKTNGYQHTNRGHLSMGLFWGDGGGGRVFHFVSFLLFSD